jgi:hypothetical protein
VLGHGRFDPLVGVHGGRKQRTNLAGALPPISSWSGVLQVLLDLLLLFSFLAIVEMEEEGGREQLVGDMQDG